MKNSRFLKNKILNKLFLFLAVSLFLIFIIALFSNSFLDFWISKNKVLPLSLSISSQAMLPIIKTNFVPQISAKGAIIMDADSNVVLYSKNPDLRFSTASTAKIMTAITALEFFKPQDVLTVREATVEGSMLGLTEGEQMTFENLLYAMLLPSANDAALTISQNYPGGSELFLEKMNQKAKLLNLYNTHFQDAAGLEDSGDYTTAIDLARLASFAIKNDTFKKIVGTKEAVITDVSGFRVYEVENLNKLLGVEGITGIKTGYTKEAGQVLVTSRVEKGKDIIFVVMGSEDRFSDTTKLLDLVSNSITYLSIHP